MKRVVANKTLFLLESQNVLPDTSTSSLRRGGQSMFEQKCDLGFLGRTMMKKNLADAALTR